MTRHSGQSKYLVPPIRQHNLDGDGPDLVRLRRKLSVYHNEIAAAASRSLPAALSVGLERWGTEMKRVRVEYGCDEKGKAKEWVLVEVINQCATIERLLDAIDWCARQEELATVNLHVCNPTQSSRARPKPAPVSRTAIPHPAGDPDHDLVLQLGADGPFWCFEVSDVANSKDSNGKATKDIVSLLNSNDGKNRMYLVGSFQHLNSPSKTIASKLDATLYQHADTCIRRVTGVSV